MVPHEVLSRLHSRCILMSENAGTVLSEKGIAIKTDVGFQNCPSVEILVVIGGSGQSDMINHSGLMTFLRKQALHARYVAGVCTGTLLLASSGLLQGRRATTHWLARDELVKYGVIPVKERVVWDGKFITKAGVSAGIDLGRNSCGGRCFKIYPEEAIEIVCYQSTRMSRHFPLTGITPTLASREV